jgi:hypothetical protein
MPTLRPSMRGSPARPMEGLSFRSRRPNNDHFNTSLPKAEEGQCLKWAWMPPVNSKVDTETRN